MKDIIKIFIFFNGIVGIILSLLGILGFYRGHLLEKIIILGRKILFSYIVSSISFWVYINRYYLIKNNLLKKIFYILPFMAILISFFEERISFLLFIPYNLYFRNIFYLLFIFPSYQLFLLLLLYYIGTEIVPTPKMITNPLVKIILILGFILGLLNKDFLLIINILIIIPMIVLTLRKFYGYRMYSLLILLLLSLSVIFSYLLGRPEEVHIANLAGVIFVANVIFLFILQDRGWILLKESAAPILRIGYIGIILEILLSITGVKIFILLLSFITLYLYLKSLALIQMRI